MMNNTRPNRRQWSTNQVVLATALFLILFANFAFFRNLYANVRLAHHRTWRTCFH